MTTWQTNLGLKGVTYYQCNDENTAKRKSLTGILIEPITVDVPAGTQFVHVAFRSVDMSFGTSTAPVWHPLQSIGFEIVDGKLVPGNKYTFELRARLATDSDVNWTPYFVFEILCFG